ncbi:MAG: TonB-dependent receptor, partial [Cytophagales bacterium]|nr:TonB-dependent receptor [Cytophaga sp.]
QSAQLVIALTYHSLNTTEVVIEDVKQQNKPVISSKEEVSGEALARSRGTTLGESIKQLPGVSNLQTGPTIFKPVIQGMYGSRVLIMNNGVRQEGQQWGNEHAPEVDPFVANKVSVIKGAQSIRYGSDAIGGVVMLEPEALNTFRGTKATLNLVGFSNNRTGVSSGIIEHGFNKIPGLAVRLQGTARKGGNTRAPDYWINNTGFQELNFSSAAAYKRVRWGVEIFYSQFNTQIGIMSAAHSENEQDLINAFNRAKPAGPSEFSYVIARPMQHVNHDLLKASTYYRFGRSRVVLEYSRQYNIRKEYDARKAYNPYLGDAAQLQFNLTTHIAQGYLEHSIGKLKGVAGIIYINQFNTYNGRFYIPNFHSQAFGIYLTESFRISNKTKAEFGLRYDYKYLKSYFYENKVIVSPERVFQSPTASIGIEHEWNRHFTLQAVAGTAFRPPNVNELYSNGLHSGTGVFEKGNKNLTSERALNVAFTLQYVFKKWYGYVHTYGYYFDGYIYLKPLLQKTTVTSGVYPTAEYTQVNATYCGFDIALNDSISRKLIYSTRVSLVSGYDLTQNDWLIYIPTTKWQNGLKYLLPSVKTFVRPYISVDGILTARKQHVPDSSDFIPPPPGYFLLQAEIGTHVCIGRQDMLLTFTVQNMLNTSYRDYMDRFRYFADAAGRNFSMRLQIPMDFTKKQK